MWSDLPHTVSWKRLTAGGEWEGDGYANAESIPARIERRSRVREGVNGTERVDETRIMVGRDHAVLVDDLLDGERVEAIDEQVNLSGDMIGRICYLEA